VTVANSQGVAGAMAEWSEGRFSAISGERLERSGDGSQLF